MSDIQRQIFDKIINVNLYKKSGGFDRIITPPTGRKPSISVQGSYVQSDAVGSVNLRIMNFYTNTPLNEYSDIELFCGYQGTLTGVIKGSIFNAYQESPGPDGITYFQLMTSGVFIDFMNAPVTRNYFAAGCQIDIVIDSITESLSNYSGKQIDKHSTLSPFDVLPIPLESPPTCKDLIVKLQKFFPKPFNYRLDGDTLFVWPSNGSTGRNFLMNYFSSPPIRQAAGIVFSAPWLPDLRPGDVVLIDPKYSRQTYGGSVANLPANLVVLTLEFEFATVLPQNHMSIYAVDTASI